MLAKRIIPCLDVADGRVVKGTHFVDLHDAGDPVELGARYGAEGADELVFLDITATVENRGATLEWVRRVAEMVFIPFSVGGGIRRLEDIRAYLRAGADKVSLNSAAFADPDLIRQASRAFGSQCVIVAVDAKREAGQAAGDGDPTWHAFSHGGRRDTGRDALSWIVEAERLGAGEILLTSMDCDGTQAGYDLELLRRACESVRIPVIASGGAGSPEDLLQAVTEGMADAVLAASIFHFGKHTVSSVKDYLSARGICVRTPFAG